MSAPACDAETIDGAPRRQSSRQPSITFSRRAMMALSAVTVSGAGMPLSAILAGVVALPSTRAHGTVGRRAIFFSLLCLTATVLVVFSAQKNRTEVSISDAANPALLAIFVVAFLKISGNLGELISLLLGIAVANVFALTIWTRGADARGQGFVGLWKYGLAEPVSIVLIAVVVRRFPIPAQVGAMVLLAGVSTALGFRSHGLVVLAAALVTLFTANRRAEGGRLRLALSALLIVTVAILLPRAMESSLFGTKVQERTIAQAENGPLIFAGRTEPPLSAAAITARPLLGWGDVDEIDPATRVQGLRNAQRIGIKDTSKILPFWFRPDGRVSLHSVTLQEMAAGGFAAGLFGVYGLFLLGRAVAGARGRHTLLVTFAAAQAFWNLLFSTWGGTMTITLAATIALSIRVIEDRVQERGETPS